MRPSKTAPCGLLILVLVGGLYSPGHDAAARKAEDKKDPHAALLGTAAPDFQ